MELQAARPVVRASAERVVSLTDNRFARWGVYGLISFPVLDYALHLSDIHPLGVIWDKVDLVVLAFIAASRYLSGVRPTWFPWHKFALLYILFGLALAFSGIANPVIAFDGWRIDVYYILFAFVLPFVVGSDDVPKLFHVGASIAILIGVDGIYQYLVRTPIPSSFWGDANVHARTRVFSVLQSPNELGAYMALMLLFIVGMAVYERNRTRRWMYALGAACCALTLLFTFTRGAWIALVLAVVVMSVLVERRLLLIVLALAVIAWFLPPIHHRIADLLSPVYWLKSSQAGRLQKWVQAFGLMIGNPLFGVGMGHYGGAVASDFHLSTYSDNYYAKVLGESGLLGLSLFLAMHISLFRDLLVNVIRKASGRKRMVTIGLVTGLLAVAIHNSIENVFEFGPMVVSYFTYASLLFIWSSGFSKEDKHEET